MEHLIERITKCLDIICEVEKQMRDEQADVFEVYAEDVQSYAMLIKDEMVEELKEQIAIRKQLAAAAQILRDAHVPTGGYRLYKTCEKYGLDAEELSEYLPNDQNWDFDGLAQCILRRIGYTEAFEYVKLFKAFSDLAVWKHVPLNFFLQDANDEQKLRYASYVATIKEAADQALRGHRICLNKDILSGMIERIELFLKEAFKSSGITVPKKRIPVYRGKAKLLGSIFGALAGAAVGGVAGYFTLIDLIMGFAIIGSGIGLVTGLLIGRSIANKKGDAIYLQGKKIEEENAKAEAEAFEKYQKNFSCRKVEVLLQTQDELGQVLQILSDACAQILYKEEFSFLPADYRYDAIALGEFVKYYDNKRVDSIKEAVNLYISNLDAERRQEELRRLEMVRIEEERRRTQMVEKNREAQAKALTEIAKQVKKMQDQSAAIAEAHANTISDIKKEAERMQGELDKAHRDAVDKKIKAEIATEKALKELGL